MLLFKPVYPEGAVLARDSLDGGEPRVQDEAVDTARDGAKITLFNSDMSSEKSDVAISRRGTTYCAPVDSPNSERAA